MYSLGDGDLGIWRYFFRHARVKAKCWRVGPLNDQQLVGVLLPTDHPMASYPRPTIGRFVQVFPTNCVPELPSTEEVGANNDNDHDEFEKSIRRSGRDRRPPQWYGNPVLTVLLMEHGEPATYKEAMAGPESEKWL